MYNRILLIVIALIISSQILAQDGEPSLYRYQHPSGGFAVAYPDTWDGAMQIGFSGLSFVLSENSLARLFADSNSAYPSGDIIQIGTVDPRRGTEYLAELELANLAQEEIFDVVYEANQRALWFPSLVFGTTNTVEEHTLPNGQVIEYMEANPYAYTTLIRRGETPVAVTAITRDGARATQLFDTIIPTIELDAALLNASEAVSMMGFDAIPLRPDRPVAYDYRAEVDFAYPEGWTRISSRLNGGYSTFVTNVDVDVITQIDMRSLNNDATFVVAQMDDELLITPTTTDAEKLAIMRTKLNDAALPVTLGSDAETITTTSGREFIRFSGEGDGQTAYATVLFNNTGYAIVFGFTRTENVAMLEMAFDQVVDTLEFDAIALTERDVPYVDDSDAELGANGFEIWGPVNRASIVMDAAVISEPTFRDYQGIDDERFDFYLTQDIRSDTATNYVGIYQIPFDIEPGEYELDRDVRGSFVSFVYGERYDTRMEGTLIIEDVDEGLSGSFVASSMDNPDGEIRGMFSNVPLPDVTPCLLSGIGGDVSYNITLTDGTTNDVLQNASWFIQPTDTYNRDFGAVKDNSFMMRFNGSLDGEDLGSFSAVTIEDIPLDIEAGETVAVRASGGSDTRTANGEYYLSTGDGNRTQGLIGGTLIFDQVGETLTGNFTLSDGDVSVEGRFANVPFPESSCRVVAPNER